MIVAIGLRFLGGEKAKSLADTFGISISSTHRVINKFLNAVDLSSHPHLSTDLLPNSYNERIQVARQWEERSSAFGCFFGCLGAIDGWLVRIVCPSYQRDDISNSTTFFFKKKASTP